MRVAVIRGDLSKALFIADVEPKSQADASVESPKGNARYVSRPSAAALDKYFASQGLSASSSSLILATVPVGGPVDVSSATIKGVSGLGSATNTQVTAIQDLLAPHFVETDAVKKSFLAGNLAGFRSSSFNPDPRRMPALTPSAAIACVQDDGTTAFTFAGPVLTTADLDTPTSGALRLSGSGLAGYGLYQFTVILSGALKKKLTQAQILAAGGSINTAGTQIDIPASLIAGAALTTTSARVQVNDLLTAAVALT